MSTSPMHFGWITQSAGEPDNYTKMTNLKLVLTLHPLLYLVETLRFNRLSGSMT